MDELNPWPFSIKPELVQILADPKEKHPITLVRDTDAREWVVSIRPDGQLGFAYSTENGIPIMLAEEARTVIRDGNQFRLESEAGKPEVAFDVILYRDPLAQDIKDLPQTSKYDESRVEVRLESRPELDFERFERRRPNVVTQVRERLDHLHDTRGGRVTLGAVAVGGTGVGLHGLGKLLHGLSKDHEGGKRDFGEALQGLAEVALASAAAAFAITQLYQHMSGREHGNERQVG